MLALDFQSLKEDLNYLTDVGHNVWLMDDHRWAFYVWERYRATLPAGTRFALIHADFHWDHIDDVADDAQFSELLPVASMDDIQQWTSRDGRPIIYDSFIAPAIRRRLISSIHWYCKQTDEDHGFQETFLRTYDCKQTFCWSLDDLRTLSCDAPIIFDLCLDLFNLDDADMYSGTIWQEQDILEFLKNTEHIYRRASVVTISLSFGYSGTEDDTRRLASLVIPRILEARTAT